MVSAQVVIIGSGFAGASTASHLTRSGLSDIVVVEQEECVGMHSSGRNAGMIHQMVSDEAVAPLVREGARVLSNLPPFWPTPVEFRQKGSLSVGAGMAWRRLVAETERIREAGVPLEVLSVKEACHKVSALERGDFDGAVWCPTDGVIDIHALLDGYLTIARAGGAKILTGAKVSAILTKKGRITAVVTESRTITTEVVINAAGAWASGIARMAGAVSVPLSPYRRHLFATSLLPWVKQDWPFVWDRTDEVYFRPESGGLLLSPCDEGESLPGIPPVDPGASLLLCEKLRRYPCLQDLPVKTVWAGLRTFAGDRRFVIGWDPLVHGFFWVAGLGGYGVTASWSIGRLAADLIIDRTREAPSHFSPARFIHQ